MERNSRKIFLISFLICILLFLLCSSYSYRINNNDVDIKTIYEDGHKYVVATMSSHNNGASSGISIIHSENCPCKNK